MQIVGLEIISIFSIPFCTFFSVPLFLTVMISTRLLPAFEARVGQIPTPANSAGPLSRRNFPHRLFSLLSYEKTTLSNIGKLVHRVVI